MRKSNLNKIGGAATTEKNPIIDKIIPNPIKSKHAPELYPDLPAKTSHIYNNYSERIPRGDKDAKDAEEYKKEK